LLEQRKQYDSIILGLETELKALQDERQLGNDVWECLRELLDKFSTESLVMLRTLINKGVASIFYDKDFEVKIEITDTKFKRLRFILVEKTEDGIKETELSSGGLLMNGGGAIVVISFILQVFLINMYGLRPFIVIDEGFTNISSRYIENFFRFLKYLHTEMGFTFLMVNHDPRFFPYFDKTYEVVAGDVRVR
jgi:DNA repair exonuclease SbcCD ATPase subunit